VWQIDSFLKVHACAAPAASSSSLIMINLAMKKVLITFASSCSYSCSSLQNSLLTQAINGGHNP
jgi:hypothetical protein